MSSCRSKGDFIIRWRPSIAHASSATIADLLAHDELRMISFYDRVSTRRVDVDALRDVDPDLQSLLNINRPEDYALALRNAGLSS